MRTAPAAPELDVLASLARTVDLTLRANLDGITHEESVIQPRPAGNCLNFILGHLVATYNQALPLVGQEPVVEHARIAQYDRGSAPLTSADAAVPFEELRGLWSGASRRFETGLLGLTSDYLDAPAPDSPSGNPDETIRSLLTVIAMHQAYHAGQVALARRLVGRPGAIR